VVVLRLPEPMLARAGRIPTGRGSRFEPKLDGFRCMFCTHAGFRARSRRGWDMTPLLPELADALPPTCSSTASSSRSTATAAQTSTG
jgi:ATP-dependent DNA ligase